MPRVAVVTGAGRGIGRAVADRLVAAGDTVAVLDADAERLAGAPGALRFAVDIADPAVVEDAIAGVERDLGPVDVLVNNVGIISTEATPIESLSLDAWRRVVDVNVTGTFVVAQRVGRAMIARGRGGAIVNVASIYGRRALDWRLYEAGPEPRRQDDGVYGVTKAAVIQLTRVLAVSWAPFGIRVACVSPGPVDTEFVRETLDAPVRGLIAGRVPAGRLADPDEIAAAIVFLASDEASYVTGANLDVDGGWTCW